MSREQAVAPPVNALRSVLIHVGTHKTGTTSIQKMLGDNADLFAQHGLLVPKTGRLQPELGAHHNIAFELCHSYAFSSAPGTFAELLVEIKQSGAQRVCLSSEEFEVLEANRGAMRKLHDGLRSIGYEPIIIIYLRPQVDYVESLFAQLVGDGKLIEFADFMRSIMRKGRFLDSRLTYTELIDEFAEVFGADRVIVRRYRASNDTAALLLDFLEIVEPSRLSAAHVSLPGRLNPKPSFSSLPTIPVSVAGLSHSTKSRPFEALFLIDIFLLSIRFAVENAMLYWRYGVVISPVTRRRLLHEVAALVERDRSLIALKAAFRPRSHMRPTRPLHWLPRLFGRRGSLPLGQSSTTMPANPASRDDSLT